MGGGLLNLVSEGNKNIFLNGNPTKTFFSTKYKKYTNFGMEKLRLDVNGSRKLNMTSNSQFNFNVRNYGDLLTDTYFVIDLPNIWSPIVKLPTEDIEFDNSMVLNYWPYEFKWIENLGSQLIKKVRYLVGGVVLQEFTGEYLLNMVKRDFSKVKSDLFDEMTGNTKELNDPANYAGRNNNYPNTIYHGEWPHGPEPSIRGRKIYVPINIWSTLSSKMAFPLLSLTKHNLRIEVTCRPIQELFVVRYIPTNNVLSDFNRLMKYYGNNLEDDIINEFINEYLLKTQMIGEYVQANQNENRYLFYRFVNPTIYSNTGEGGESSDTSLGFLSGTSSDKQYFESSESIWNADAHLLCNYVFLSEDERNVFKNKKQQYLVKFVDETDYLGLEGTKTIRLFKDGLVTSWMWFLQRNDVHLRNQWSNYTNWKDSELPFPTINCLVNNHTDIRIPSLIYRIFGKQTSNNNGIYNLYNSSLNNFLRQVIDSNLRITNSYVSKFISKPFNISGPYHVKNEKNIMKSASIVFDGKIRENFMVYNIYNQVEPYLRSNGTSTSGLLCYNFCLDTDPFNMQPSGAINLSKFSVVNMEVELIEPEKDLQASTKLLVDDEGVMLGINKSEWEIFSFKYRLHFMQERYILIEFENGNISINNLI